jgi:hypothetical protein
LENFDSERCRQAVEGYAIATPDGNDPAKLLDWVKRFPEFADDLLAFAAMRAVAEKMPEEEISAEEEAADRARALERLRGLASPRRIESLVRAAESAGLARAQFAAAIGVSLSLLVYLEKRRIRAATVPRKMIRRISEAIKQTEDAVSAYLSLPSDGALGANYKTGGMPGNAFQKAFADAVREDQTLTAAQKEELLNLAD